MLKKKIKRDLEDFLKNDEMDMKSSSKTSVNNLSMGSMNLMV